MPYWNRDLSDPKLDSPEPFKVWHDECFPVYMPTTAEKFGPFGIETTNEEYAADTFGGRSYGSLAMGMEHLIELALTSSYYADAIERYMTDTHRFTPDGYAWAPWPGGRACEVCGQEC